MEESLKSKRFRFPTLEEAHIADDICQDHAGQEMTDKEFWSLDCVKNKQLGHIFKEVK